jgi:hypothetical protein
MIINITGTLIPNRLEPEFDVLKIEREKTSDEYKKDFKEGMTKGVQDLIDSPQMPTINMDNWKMDHAEAVISAAVEYNRLGFMIPEILPAEYEAAAEDTLFMVALLPPGWQKVKSNNEMDCYVLDQNNTLRIICSVVNSKVERAAYYKIVPRFSFNSHSVQELCTPDLHIRRGEVIDAKTGIAIFQAPDAEITISMTGTDALNIEYALQAHCYKWLRENYPEWKNPFSYWD